MSRSHRYGISEQFTNRESRNKVFHRSLGFRMVARIDGASNHSSSKLRFDYSLKCKSCEAFPDGIGYKVSARSDSTLSVASTHCRLAGREGSSHNSCRLPRCRYV